MLPRRFFSTCAAVSVVPPGLGSILFAQTQDLRPGLLSVVPPGLVPFSSRLTQDLRPFDKAQGRLWAIIWRRSGTWFHFLEACGTTEVVPFPGLLVAGGGPFRRDAVPPRLRQGSENSF
jgi:hypothetical protein